MKNNDSVTPQAYKKKQYKSFCIGVAIVFISVISVLLMLPTSENKNALSSTAETASLATPLAHVDITSVVVQKAENRLIAIQKENQSFQQQLQTIQQTKQTDRSQLEKQILETQQLTERLSVMEKQVSALTSASLKPTTPPSSNETNAPLVTVNDSHSPSDKVEDPLSTTIIRVDGQQSSLSKKIPVLSKTLMTPNVKNPNTYVPSGTFTQAVMMGGADASAAVNSQANPIPMLFRIIDEGTLPNQRRSHLKNCFVTAAVVGDISSERGNIRLETLSCTTPNNTIIDMPVQGTVFGPEGKNGVRGIPLWREGAVLQRAFAAGALSGLADGLSQQNTTNTVSPLGSTTSINPSGLFQYGAAQGASHAMTKLADYNIRRAEQYHPVIQLSAGTVVDIVFLKGFYLDGKKHEESHDMLQSPEPSMTTTEESSSTVASAEHLSPLPLTEQQINRLKSRDAELGFTTSTPSSS
jgi:conjugal transfer pilus assembly protein TraB